MYTLPQTQSSKEPKAADTRCPKQFKCPGWLANVTSRIQEVLGFIHLRCDTCQREWAVRVKGRAGI